MCCGNLPGGQAALFNKVKKPFAVAIDGESFLVSSETQFRAVISEHYYYWRDPSDGPTIDGDTWQRCQFILKGLRSAGAERLRQTGAG